MTFIRLYEIEEPDAGAVGNKAARLGKMHGIGFPIPPGLVLTTTAFRQAMAPYQDEIQRLLSASNLHALAEVEAVATTIGELLASATLPTNVQFSLEQELAELRTTATKFAVRSSATAEDTEAVSFAGQYESVLGVSKIEDIVAAVLTCWRSYYSAHALSARASHAELENDGMAVLIMPLIEAECSGIAFSLDPVQQNAEHIVVNAVWGLGPGVVDGRLLSDTAWLRRDTLRTERHDVAHKSDQVVVINGQLQHVEVPEEQRRAACLPPDWLTRVAQYALAAEQWLGAPQEIEWAIADGQLWLLQSRPITGLSSDLTQPHPSTVTWTDEMERRQLWELTHWSKRDSPPLLPIEQDYAMAIVDTREETCRWLGMERNWATKWVNGRLYALSIPVGLPEADMRIRRAANHDLKERWRQQGLTSWDYWGPEIVRATERLRAFDAQTADDATLAGHVEEALAVARRHNMLHPMTTSGPPASYINSFEALTGLSGDAATTQAHQLLEGLPTVLTRLTDALYDLAQAARPHVAVVGLIKSPPPDILEQLQTLPEATAVRRRLDDLLTVHGERVGHGYGSHTNLSMPTWRERPQVVLQLAAHYLDSAVEAPKAVRARVQKARDARVEALCAACEDVSAVETFRRELDYARRAFTVLEEHNHYIDQMALGQLRQALMAAAARLVERDVLTTKDDVLWLQFGEIVEALRSEEPPEFTALIRERQDRYALWEQMEPPPFLGIPDEYLDERPPWTDDVGELAASTSDLVTGLGASSGRVSGRAHVLTTNDGLPALAPGEILVAHNVGPRWTPLFPNIGGLVLDSGSIGQHAASTAREYGLPAVIATRNATQVIIDGDWITVDGTAGTVTIDRDN